MKGFGYALEKRWADMTEEQRRMMLTGIVHDADRMDQILRLLVDAARVSGGTLEPYPDRVDLAELVAARSATCSAAIPSTRRDRLDGRSRARLPRPTPLEDGGARL